jgi:hypothetical protein
LKYNRKYERRMSMTEEIEHMWNGCSEMRERKERGEILNQNGREIRWMKKRYGRGGKG